jgi:hypothetical protein
MQRASDDATRASRTPPPGLGLQLGYGAGSAAFGIGGVALSATLLQVFFNEVIGLPPRSLRPALEAPGLTTTSEMRRSWKRAGRAKPARTSWNPRRLRAQLSSGGDGDELSTADPRTD